jgi:hypothetical protein
MATPPTFSAGQILTSGAMNDVGLWLVSTQDVGSTPVASVTVTAAFSADYDNYFVTYTGGVASTSNQLRIRMGATNSGYYSQTIYATYGGAGPLANVPDNNAAQWSFVGRANTNFTYLQMNLSTPFLTTRTFMNTFGISSGDMAATAGFLDNATSYTDFDIICSTGTITGGTIRVYGYRN